MKYLVRCFTIDDGNVYYGFESNLVELELNKQLKVAFEKSNNKSDFVFQGMKFRKHGALYAYSVLSLKTFWQNCLNMSQES